MGVEPVHNWAPAAPAGIVAAEPDTAVGSPEQEIDTREGIPAGIVGLVQGEIGRKVFVRKKKREGDTQEFERAPVLGGTLVGLLRVVSGCR